MPLLLREAHASAGAKFAELGGLEIVTNYGGGAAEYDAITQTVGVMDFSFRGRVCVVGADRKRFLHGQVTNDIKRLQVGQGCYAALTTAKGKMQSDLNIFCLPDEILLDFEPGLTPLILERLGRYIVADDVELVDAAPHYGLLSVIGPSAAECLGKLQLGVDLPSTPLSSVKVLNDAYGEIYLARSQRVSELAFDLFVPNDALRLLWDRVTHTARDLGGRPCGWDAFEMARIESGIPRFGVDMDETNIPSECGIEARAISYQKGCYIGQEVLNRIHSIGHVNRKLCGLGLPPGNAVPAQGDVLVHAGKEVGHVTSATFAPRWQRWIALGYLRREVADVGTTVSVRSEAGEAPAEVVILPRAAASGT